MKQSKKVFTFDGFYFDALPFLLDRLVERNLISQRVSELIEYHEAYQDILFVNSETPTEFGHELIKEIGFSYSGSDKEQKFSFLQLDEEDNSLKE